MTELSDLVWPVARWYLAVQLCAAAALPFCLSFFYALPDRGYALAKICGILMVGYLLWIGAALGLLRNETGGAWLALALAAGLSLLYAHMHRTPSGGAWRDIDMTQFRTQILWVEVLFLVALVGWAYVRAHDPAANHTEQPMDLMFLNSIWHSPTFPPQDAWLAGYAISYYYFGYWLLATTARLANTPPEIAYNAGQAAWFGLLLVSCYGIGYNLLAFRVANNRLKSPTRNITVQNWQFSSRLGGLFAVCGVALAGNLQAILEWLYANGALTERLARWVSVNNFPDNAAVTGQWYIGLGGWWWWRTSRVISDRNLVNGHIEVIDEFPMFSYVLGDNHPHVLAMPVALLVIGIAMHLLFSAYRNAHGTLPEASAAAISPSHRESKPTGLSVVANSWMATMQEVPGGLMTLVIAGLAVGSLFFLNTWDFPPYWGLLILIGAAAPAVRSTTGLGDGRVSVIGRAAMTGVGLLVGALVFFAPYLLTAQSQAGGMMPNFFNPTRIQQFLVMFGAWAPATLLLLWVGVRTAAPAGYVWRWTAILVFGAPVIFLVATAILALGTEGGRAALAEMPRPEDAEGYGAIMLARWLRQGYTFLTIGAALVCAAATLWAWFVPGQSSGVAALRTHNPAAHARMGFALLLLLCGLILVFIPEFVFLRDQFGTRMNTIFKFYYQAWLLWGLAGAYIVVEQLRGGTLIPFQSDGQHRRGVRIGGHFFALASLGLVLACLTFPVTATFSKTGGFAANSLTLDATRYIDGPAPAAAAAVRWIREHTEANARILEAEGNAYSAEHNRVSTMTGRPTLLGWPGHQRQWRGDAYAEMAGGRSETIAAIYRSRDPVEAGELLVQWEIDYVYVSPVERREYQMSDVNEATLARVATVVFEMGDVRLYRVASTVNGGGSR